MNAKGPLIATGRTAEVFALGDDKVLKLLRPGFPPALADREATILRRARAGGIACPAVEAVVNVEGRRGIVLDRLVGPSMLDRMMSDLRAAPQWGPALAELHATLHAHAVDEPPSHRQRLRGIIGNGHSLEPRRRDEILRRLDNLPDGQAVCHGDFHPGNVILTDRGPVIIDWLDATLGDSVGDVARTMLLLELGRPPVGFLTRWRLEAVRGEFVRAYASRYRVVRPIPEARLRGWRAVVAAARLEEGIPGERRRLLRMISEIA